VIIEHKENISSDFVGTVIDIETIGEFDDQYTDSRRYEGIQIVIFGFMNKCFLHVLCAQEREAIGDLRERIEKIIDSLERPFYAFNCGFETGVLFCELGREIYFDGELQEAYESKRKVVRNLDIPNYDDPFYDRGLWCMNAWHNGEFDAAIAHNRACLLKERDILLKRGFRTPDELLFVRKTW